MSRLNCPGYDPVWGEIIDDFEKAGHAKVAAKWAERLCKADKFHHGSWSSCGPDKKGVVEEEQSCWNCNYRVKRTTQVVSPATTQRVGKDE